MIYFYLNFIFQGFTFVALSLSSAGDAIYRVSYDVDERAAPTDEHLTREAVPIPCRSECINPATNQSYHIKDLCTPEVFREHCPDCEKVQCVFTLYKEEENAAWMRWFNLFGLYWGMFFFSALSEVTKI